MKEKVGIIAGVITFLGFSALCVSHHAGTSESLHSALPPAASSPSVATQHHPSGSPAVVPTSTPGGESPTVVVPAPVIQPQASIPQTIPVTQEPPRPQNPVPSLRSKVIEFFADSDVLTPKGRDALQTLLPGLRSQPVLQVEIAGHTDNLGREDYNRDLSQRRAERVKHYFITHGIAEDHLVAQGYGSSLPIADNATDEGRQRNRRTEIIIQRATPQS